MSRKKAVTVRNHARELAKLLELSGLLTRAALEVQLELTERIVFEVRRLDITHVNLARLAGTSRPRVTAILNGNLEGVSTPTCYCACIAALNVRVELRFRTGRLSSHFRGTSYPAATQLIKQLIAVATREEVFQLIGVDEHDCSSRTIRSPSRPPGSCRRTRRLRLRRPRPLAAIARCRRLRIAAPRAQRHPASTAPLCVGTDNRPCAPSSAWRSCHRRLRGRRPSAPGSSRPRGAPECDREPPKRPGRHRERSRGVTAAFAAARREISRATFAGHLFRRRSVEGTFVSSSRSASTRRPSAAADCRRAGKRFQGNVSDSREPPSNG